MGRAEHEREAEGDDEEPGPERAEPRQVAAPDHQRADGDADDRRTYAIPPTTATKPSPIAPDVAAVPARTSTVAMNRPNARAPGRSARDAGARGAAAAFRRVRFFTRDGVFGRGPGRALLPRHGRDFAGAGRTLLRASRARRSARRAGSRTRRVDLDRDVRVRLAAARPRQVDVRPAAARAPRRSRPRCRAARRRRRRVERRARPRPASCIGEPSELGYAAVEARVEVDSSATILPTRPAARSRSASASGRAPGG